MAENGSFNVAKASPAEKLELVYYGSHASLLLDYRVAGAAPNPEDLETRRRIRDFIAGQTETSPEQWDEYDDDIRIAIGSFVRLLGSEGNGSRP